MHRALSALALLCIAAAVLAATATAATPTDKKVAALARQVTALQKQVKTLTTQVTALKKTQKTDEGGIGAAILLGLCTSAIASDALAGTWNVVDQIPGGPVKFGPQTVLDDKGACQALSLTRSQTIPPTLVAYQALLALGSPNPLSPFQAVPAWLAR